MQHVQPREKRNSAVPPRLAWGEAVYSRRGAYILNVPCIHVLTGAAVVYDHVEWGLAEIER